MKFACWLFVLGVQSAWACTPPRDGSFQMPSPEAEARLLVTGSDSAYIATFIDEREIIDPGHYVNREARFKVGKVIYGSGSKGLRYMDSTCGSPLLRSGPVVAGRSLLVVARGNELLRVFAEPSEEAALFRRMAAERKASAPRKPP